jgi:transcriptional regulator with XRE-family HTH domain
VAFGNRVRRLREQQGLTQEQLAERLEVDRKTVNRLENGAYSPALDRVFGLAGVLGVAVADLFVDV